jgi:branched-subunit amino acid aminotransferase/4-amino-4-deoxychorismate lyase
MTSELLRFSSGKLREVPISLGTQLAVADSFLLEDGRIRSLRLHLDRFRNWVELVAADEFPFVEDFFEKSIAELPTVGRWFPRFELHTDQPTGHRLHLRVREAPDALGSAILWTYPDDDPRVNPLVKGPDLSLGLQLRRRANMLGADEAVLLSDSGHIAEGALSAIVWWRGDVLCAPSDETTWLDSITRREVFAIAEQMGLQTRIEKAKPADLVETEVWMLSSLQAIRPVDSWIDLGGPLAPASHVEAFSKRLRMLSSPIRSSEAN